MGKFCVETELPHTILSEFQYPGCFNLLTLSNFNQVSPGFQLSTQVNGLVWSCSKLSDKSSLYIQYPYTDFFFTCSNYLQFEVTHGWVREYFHFHRFSWCCYFRYTLCKWWRRRWRRTCSQFNGYRPDYTCTTIVNRLCCYKSINRCCRILNGDAYCSLATHQYTIGWNGPLN